jgi:hypothetical protein
MEDGIMGIIKDTLQGLELGPPETHRNLSLFPLIGGREKSPAYLTLDEAIGQGVARVTEVSVGGSVPQLKFVNDGDRPVLLLDGEELVGAKQNRVLNLTVYAPPRATIVIPVSCVEAGRWAYSARESFVGSPRVMYSGGRLAKAMQVSSSLKERGMRLSDQSAVWAQLDQMAARLSVATDTGAMADIYEKYTGNIEDYVRELIHVDGQVGAIFAVDGQVLGLELLDHPQTMRRLLPKLVRSYALDAIASDAASAQAPPLEAAREFRAEVGEAKIESRPAVGLGEDLRLEAETVAGGALVHDGRVVHLAAFRLDRKSTADTPDDAGPERPGQSRPTSRISSVRNRLRNWRERN